MILFSHHVHAYFISSAAVIEAGTQLKLKSLTIRDVSLMDSHLANVTFNWAIIKED
jgi:hypothetical protein